MNPEIADFLKRRAEAVAEIDRKRGTTKWDYPLDRRPHPPWLMTFVPSAGVSERGVLSGFRRKIGV